MSRAWQLPFVNVFKHFGVGKWTKSAMQGEVSEVMDKALRCTVFRISGSVPASNFIQLPKISSQSLGLVGRHVYVFFKAIPDKHFMIHLDVATEGGMAVRVSFSNLFKEFKATSTWLQFPFTCVTPRWAVLSLDLHTIMQTYVNRKFLYIKGIKLCANMLVRNVMTSDHIFTVAAAHDHDGGEDKMPREMSFFVPKGERWDDIYDHISFPFQDAPPEEALQLPVVDLQLAPLHISMASNARRRTNGASIVRHNLPSPFVTKSPLPAPSTSLPQVGLEQLGNNPESGQEKRLVQNEKIRRIPVSLKENRGASSSAASGAAASRQQLKQVSQPLVSVEAQAQVQGPNKLGPRGLPDPVLDLTHILGINTHAREPAAFAAGTESIVFAAGNNLIHLNTLTKKQTFLLGHTDKISCISRSDHGYTLASASRNCLRVWDLQRMQCIRILPQKHSVQALCISADGALVCSVGKDQSNKTAVTLTNVLDRTPRIEAQTHTDADLTTMRFAPLGDTKLVSIGRSNIRIWRLKNGSLRSCSVDLHSHHAPTLELTDVAVTTQDLQLQGAWAFVAATSGQVFRVDCTSVKLDAVFDLKCRNISCIRFGSEAAVTGTQDGQLRVWSKDFADYNLEVSLEGAVSSVGISNDGHRVLATTARGNVGVLDVEAMRFSTVLRAHGADALGVAIDSTRAQLVSCSADNSIRVWDISTLDQLYEFGVPGDKPCSVAVHPLQHILAAGFESGAVRIFNVDATEAVAQLKKHAGAVTRVFFSKDGRHLYSAAEDGVLVLHNVEADYTPKHMLTFSRPSVACVVESRGGSLIACVGPTKNTITILESETLESVTSISLGAQSALSDTAEIISIAFSKNDKQLFVSTACRRLMRVDIQSGAIESEVGVAKTPALNLCLSPSGQIIAACGESDGTIRVWHASLERGSVPQQFVGHAHATAALAFTSDGSKLVSAGDGIFFWNVADTDPKSQLPFSDRAASVLGHADADLQQPSTSDESSSRGSELLGAAQIQRQPKKLDSGFPRRDNGEFPRADPSTVPASAKNLSRHVAWSDSPRHEPPQHASLDLTDTDGEERVPRRTQAPATLPPKFVHHSIPFDIPRGAALDHDSQLEGAASAIDNDEELTEFLINETGERLREGLHDAIQLNKSKSPLPGRQPKPQHEQPRKEKDFDAHVGLPLPSPASAFTARQPVFHFAPASCTHFKSATQHAKLSAKRFAPPEHQAGIQLARAFGVNSRVARNAVWHASTGLFVYTCGSLVIIDNLETHEQAQLQGHTEEISALAVSNDGATVASAGCVSELTDNLAEVRLWCVTTLQCTHRLLYHPGAVTCLSFSRDDRLLATIGNFEDSSVALWDTHDGRMISASQCEVPVNAVAWDPHAYNEFVCVGDRGSLLFWLLDETQDMAVLNVHNAELPVDLVSADGVAPHLTSVAYTDDGFVLVGDSTGTVSRWDTRSNTCEISWSLEVSEISALVTAGASMLTATSGGRLRVWSFVAGPTASVVQEDELVLDDAILSAHFDPVLAMGVVFTSAAVAWMVNWVERGHVRLLSGHTACITSVVPSLCGRFFASSSQDGSVKVWSQENQELVMSFQVPGDASAGNCRCVAFSPDSERVAAGYDDGTVRLFDLTKADLEAKFAPHSCAVTALTFSGDGRVVISGNKAGTMVVSSGSTGMSLRVLNDHKGSPVTSFDVLPPMSLIAGQDRFCLWLAASADRRISVWNADWSNDFSELVDWITVAAPAPVSGYREPPTLARFSPVDPNMVLFTCFGEKPQIHFYSVSLRKVVKRIGMNDHAMCMSVSPRGSLIAVGTEGRIVRIIDYNQGTFQDFVGHYDGVCAMTFDRQGCSLLTAALDEILLWKVLF